MTRLSPALAATATGLNARTLHRWARDGRITRHVDGFDVDELLDVLASRDLSALLSRAGVSFADRERLGLTRPASDVLAGPVLSV